MVVLVYVAGTRRVETSGFSGRRCALRLLALRARPRAFATRPCDLYFQHLFVLFDAFCYRRQVCRFPQLEGTVGGFAEVFFFSQ